MVLVFAINANAEDQKRKKGFREKGFGEKKRGKWKNPRSALPTRERRESRGTKEHTNNIQRNAVIRTVPGSSYSKENHQGGKNRTFGGGRRAQEGENRDCRERSFEGDEQCGVAERMNVTVG